jgi:hypothetical protein
MIDLVLIGIFWLFMGMFWIINMDYDGLFDWITNRLLRVITKLIAVIAWPTILPCIVIGLLVLSFKDIIPDIKRLFR